MWVRIEEKVLIYCKEGMGVIEEETLLERLWYKIITTIPNTEIKKVVKVINDDPKRKVGKLIKTNGSIWEG